MKNPGHTGSTSIQLNFGSQLGYRQQRPADDRPPIVEQASRHLLAVLQAAAHGRAGRTSRPPAGASPAR